MADDRFRVSSTMSDLKNKLKINIEDDRENIYWYIKFNLVLDKKSATNKTMQVIDTDGYIMRTYITYDTYRHLIVVSPLDSYMENKYYILSISKKVKSQKGQHLKKEIHILFMLINNQISKYEILKSTAKLPEPKLRPNNYDEIISLTESPTANMQNPKQETLQADSVEEYDYTENTSQAEDKTTQSKKQTLPFKSFKFNLLFVMLGIALLGGGAFTGFIPIFFVGVILFIFGFLIIIRQAYDARSKIYYNIGAYNFNKGKYEKSYKYLEKSFKIDRNKYSRIALNKLQKYL